LKIFSLLLDVAGLGMISAAIPGSIQIRRAPAAASTTPASAPRPISTVRPVDLAAIVAQRAFYEIPLVGDDDILRRSN